MKGFFLFLSTKKKSLKVTRLCQKLGDSVGHVEKVKPSPGTNEGFNFFKTSRGMERLGLGEKNEGKVFQESRLSPQKMFFF